MKKYIIIASSIVLLLAVAFFFQSEKEVNSSGLWKDADYLEDTVIGEGSKTVIVAVVAGDKTINFTVNTDAAYLDDALCEHDLISGEEGPYGLYVISVNGIVADYDVNQSYWSVTKDGEYVATGVSDIAIEDGDKYEFTYTK